MMDDIVARKRLRMTPLLLLTTAGALGWLPIAQPAAVCLGQSPAAPQVVAHQDEDAPGQATTKEAGKESGVILTEFRKVTPTAGSSPRKSNSESDKKSSEKSSLDDDLQLLDAKGTSATAVRKQAIGGLPLNHLTPEHRQIVEGVVTQLSYFRRMPTITVAVDPRAYSYFIAHPDVAVSIWRAMKISKMQLWQTGRYDYEGDAGDGTIGTMQVLMSTPEHTVVLSDGVYKNPLLAKPITARSILYLQTTYSKDADGTLFATHRADLFVAFPSQTVDAVSRFLSPLTSSVADRTFVEVSLFLKMMSMAMSRRPDWVERIVDKMDGVAQLRKQQVLTLTAQLYSTTIRNEAGVAAPGVGSPDAGGPGTATPSGKGGPSGATVVGHGSPNGDRSASTAAGASGLVAPPAHRAVTPVGNTVRPATPPVPVRTAPGR